MFLVFKVDQTSLIIHSAVRLATGPYALPKRVLQKKCDLVLPRSIFTVLSFT